jgi:LEA14-like dessication related protein
VISKFHAVHRFAGGSLWFGTHAETNKRCASYHLPGGTMHRFSNITASLLIGITLAACSALPYNAEQPKVSIAEVNLTSVGLLEQTFTFGLRIQNPNDFELEVNAVTFDLDINDKSFASGLSGKAIKIGKFSSEVMQVEATSTGFALLRQAMSLSNGEKKTFSYRLKGTARIGADYSRLPFTNTGEIELPKMFSASDKTAS